MRYKNKEDPLRFTRELRRMFEVEIYDGEPHPDTPIIVETIIAFNATHAIRLMGNRRVVKQPEALFFVTYPPLADPDAPIYRINDTSGPTTERAEPSMNVKEKKGEGMLKVESGTVTHHD